MPVPLYPDKYREPSLVDPGRFLDYMDETGFKGAGGTAAPPEAVILSYQPALFAYVTRNHPVRFHPGLFRKKLAYLEETDGRVAIMGGFGFGAPAAIATFEELIALGARSFVSMGTAGALVPGLRPGDLVLCDGAFRDEGTSYHYAPAGGPALPDEALTEALADAIGAAGVAFRRGRSWTTDAPYRETRAEIDAFAADGALVVEMEASALFTVARYRGVALASAFTISDSLAEPEWEPDFLSKPTNAGLETLYRAALAALGA